MTITFDLFTKRNRLFYIGIIVPIVTILPIAIMAILKFQPKPSLEPLFKVLIGVLASLFIPSMLGFVIPASYGLIRTYIKDGELIMGDDYLIIDGTKILLTEAKNLSFRIGYRISRRFGRIVGNRISVIDKNGNLHNRRFVISSRDNTVEFDTTAAEWVKDGVDFGLIYYNILS
jgi:hypothetical protein